MKKIQHPNMRSGFLYSCLNCCYYYSLDQTMIMQVYECSFVDTGSRCPLTDQCSLHSEVCVSLILARQDEGFPVL